MKDNLSFNDTALAVLKERYLHIDPKTGVQETPRQMLERVARVVSQGDEKKYREYYDIMAALDFLPNSPTLMNAGREGVHGQLSACFVLDVPDSMAGIFDALKYQALIHKSGGGTGFNFSKLRAKGALVNSTNGRASGPVSFMELFDMSTEKVMQGGMRRGANMGILNVSHPDIMEFIHCKSGNEHSLKNFNISVGITDEFMYDLIRLKSDEPLNSSLSQKELQELVNVNNIWSAICHCAWRSGDPGVVFLDTIERDNPTPEYGKLDATNPCLRGNMRVLTSKGYVAIEELIDQDTEIWNGYEWSQVRPRITGHDQKMVQVTFSNGASIDCTPYHSFLLIDGSRVEAKDLKEGDALALHSLPVIEAPAVHPTDYMWCAGFYAGDGVKRTAENQDAYILLYDQKRKLLKRFDKYASRVNVLNNGKRICVVLKDEWRWEKRFVATAAYSVQERLAYLAGLIDSDGTRQSKEGGFGITSIDLDFLERVRDTLNSLGCPATIAITHPEQKKDMPDGHGGEQEYTCQTCYRLVVSPWYTRELCRLGLKTYRVNLKGDPKRCAARLIRVKSVEETEDASVVYCLTEHKNHTMVVNGTLTGQCGEQPLLPFEACNLGSLNLSNFVVCDGDVDPEGYFAGRYINFDRLGKVVQTAVSFLNDVIDVNHYPLPEIEAAVKRTRKVGLGIMGWADTLFKLGIRYGSEESYTLACVVMSFISCHARRASSGRNASVLCIAPTGTISLLAGCSSGIEPVFALQHKRVAFANDVDENGNSKRQVFEVFNPEYEAALKANDSRLAAGVFVTAQEIAPIDHVKMQAAFQKFVDAAISKTVNLPHEATVEDISDIYIEAWKRGCKGVTVYRDGCKQTQVLYAEPAEKEKCPECGSTDIIHESGCKRCDACGWSPCSI